MYIWSSFVNLLLLHFLTVCGVSVVQILGSDYFLQLSKTPPSILCENSLSFLDFTYLRYLLTFCKSELVLGLFTPKPPTFQLFTVHLNFEVCTNFFSAYTSMGSGTGPPRVRTSQTVSTGWTLSGTAARVTYLFDTKNATLHRPEEDRCVGHVSDPFQDKEDEGVGPGG